MKLAEVIESKSNGYADIDREFGQRYHCHLWQPLPSDASLPADPPRFSIVIPCYNASQTLPAVIDSLAAQAFPPGRLEVIFVDDGSTDDTWQVLRRTAARLPCNSFGVRHDGNQGRAAARNTGAGRARHANLMFLDADVLAPRRLLIDHALKHALADNLLLCSLTEHVPMDEQLVERLRRDGFDYALAPDADWRHRATIESDAGMQVISNVTDTDYFQSFGHGLKYFAKTLPEMVVSACLSMSSDLFFQIGGFCERFVGWGREDVFVGAKAIAHDALVIPELHVLYQLDTAEARAESEARKPAELADNRRRYERLMQEPLDDVIRDDRRALFARRPSGKVESWPDCSQQAIAPWMG